MRQLSLGMRAIGRAAIVSLSLLAMFSAATPVAADAAATQAAAGCVTSSSLSSLGLRSTAKTSSDGVSYVMWSGKAPSWDGMPLSIDLTLPADSSCSSRPLVAMNHGYGSDKTAWETADMNSYGLWFHHWNNVWLASRGYAVLTLTARGFHDSCGPDASTNRLATGLPAACTAGGRHYWIDFDDARYSGRDLQWIIGRLVDAGVADPSRVAVTGSSMGGGLSSIMALANDRTMCGGAAWDPSNGADPCAGQSDGSLVAWRSPQGTPLHIAAAVPEFTWANLADALAPGANIDAGIPGIPRQDWVVSLFQKGVAAGFFEPAGAPAGWGTTLWSLAHSLDTRTAGTAIGQSAIAGLARMVKYQSPTSPSLAVDAAVPMMIVDGYTDSIFPTNGAEAVRSKLTTFAATYPVELVLGDVGHPAAANAADEWVQVSDRMNAFLDRYLKGEGAARSSTATGFTSRCDQVPGSALQTHSAIGSLEASAASMELDTIGLATVGVTSDRATGAELTSPGVLDSSTCLSVTTGWTPGIAHAQWWIPRATALVGSPVATLQLRATANDAQVHVRLWVMSAATGREWLMGRGVTRFVSPPSTADSTVQVRLSANDWKLAPGNILRVDVSGADPTRFQTSAIPGQITVDRVSLHLPTID